MTILRRVLLLWIFMFWQCGFMFYGAVVVPISTEYLGSAISQGFITRVVAHCLNIAGGVALIAWIVDLVCEPQTGRKRRWAAWLFLVASLALLGYLHFEMDALMDLESYRLPDRSRPAFRYLHRWYLWTCTVQWAMSLALTYWTLQNWRATDRQALPSRT